MTSCLTIDPLSIDNITLIEQYKTFELQTHILNQNSIGSYYLLEHGIEKNFFLLLDGATNSKAPMVASI